jgi:hypothetical protein
MEMMCRWQDRQQRERERERERERGLIDGMDTNPAVSQSWSRTVLSSRYMVLLKKSIPMVAWYVLSNVSYMKRVMMLVLPTAFWW